MKKLLLKKEITFKKGIYNGNMKKLLLKKEITFKKGIYNSADEKITFEKGNYYDKRNLHFMM